MRVQISYIRMPGAIRTWWKGDGQGVSIFRTQAERFDARDPAVRRRLDKAALRDRSLSMHWVAS